MAESIDQLQIDIEAQAVKANDAIDKFIGLSNGVNRLSSAMQSISNVKTSQFTSLTKNIEKFGNLDVASLNSAASSMSHLS